jgi:hypothetical protein
MRMHRAIKPIALVASAVLGLGLATAAAADSHGDVVGALAKASKSLVGEARGDVISALAKTNGKSDRVKADTATTERDTQGDTVSLVAQSDATAAHTTGNKTVNHGGAVSAAAHKR